MKVVIFLLQWMIVGELAVLFGLLMLPVHFRESVERIKANAVRRGTEMAPGTPYRAAVALAVIWPLTLFAFLCLYWDGEK